MKNINELIDTNLNIEINNLSDNSKQIEQPAKQKKCNHEKSCEP